MQTKSMTHISFFIFIITYILCFTEVIKFNRYSFALTIIIAVPFISSYLDSLNIFGNNFNFKKSIDKIENLTTKATEEVQESFKDESKDVTEYPSAFSVSQSKELLSIDSTLALASLRIEIEKSLKALCLRLNIKNAEKTPLRKIIHGLNKINILSKYHVDALNEILITSNKAMHGGIITDDEAEKIIDLAEKLSKSFGIGYIPNFNINPDYKEQGLICEWEHCVEFMPLKSQPDEASCKIFGHDCPGGKEFCRNCDKTLDNVLKKNLKN